MVGWIVVDISREEVANNFNCILIASLKGTNLDSFGRKGDVSIWITLLRWGKGRRGTPGALMSSTHIWSGFVIVVVDDIETRSDGFVVLTMGVRVNEIQVEKGF
jgi:hypothetical protein